ncbi:MAG TPA: methyltransferase domain-containing protein, partial [bacterium]|nr:methyltransferase domain-containing protein [bacterium]
RPERAVRQIVIEPMRAIAQDKQKKIDLLRNIYIYVSNANQGLIATGEELYPKGEFTTKTRRVISQIIDEFNLEIVPDTERPYRVVLRPVQPVSDPTYIPYLKTAVEQRLERDGEGYISVSESGWPGEDRYLGVDITSSSKAKGLEDLRRHLSERFNRQVNDKEVFICGDQPDGNDRPILVKDGAYSVKGIGPAKTAALIRSSVFVSVDGKAWKFVDGSLQEVGSNSNGAGSSNHETGYKAISKPTAFLSSDYNRQIFDSFFDEINRDSGSSVARAVDAGSGLGFNLALLSNKFPNANILAVEISGRMLSISRRLPNAQAVEENRQDLRDNFGFKSSHVDSLKKARGERGFDPNRVNFVEGSIDNLSMVDDNSVDVILISEVIEHVENPQRVISEFRRVLRPGGYLVMSFPNYFNVAGIVKVYKDYRAKRRYWDAWGSHKDGRENLFTSFSMRKLLIANGFKIRKTFGVNYFLAMLVKASKWLSGKGYYDLGEKYPGFRLSRALPFLQNFAMNYFILAQKEESSKSTARAFSDLATAINRQIKVLQRQFGLDQAIIVEFKERLFNTFSNRERALRYLESLSQIKIRNPKISFAQAIENNSASMYLASREVALHLMPAFRTYRGQKVFVLARNTKLVKALSALRNSQAGFLISDKLGVVLPDEDDIIHMKISRFGQLEDTLNSLLSESERSYRLTVSDIEALKQGITDDNLLRLADECKNKTRAEAVAHLVRSAELDQRITIARELFLERDSMFNTIEIANNHQGENNSIVLQRLLNWIERLSDFAQKYPEIGLDLKEIEDLRIAITQLSIEERAKALDMAKTLYRRASAKTLGHFANNEIRYTTLILLRRLLSNTIIGQEIQQRGVMFLEDIVSLGNTTLFTKLVHQILSGDNKFYFVTMFDSSRFPAGSIIDLSDWTQVPEDWQDAEPILEYQHDKDILAFRAYTIDDAVRDLSGGRIAEGDISLEEYSEYLDLVGSLAQRIRVSTKAAVSYRIVLEVARLAVDEYLHSKSRLENRNYSITNRFVREYLRPNAAVHNEAIEYLVWVDNAVNQVVDGRIAIS